ncbi:MAG: IS5 family transposase [Bacteroidales bacterium]|nr:IS5 family transposase [Bacteroidales bacterium]
MRFLGLSLEDSVPDHSTLSRFRSELSSKRAFDRLLRKVNKQLESQGAKLNKGKTIVDATITISPFVPNEKPVYEIAEDRNEDDRDVDEMQQEEHQQQWIKKAQPGVDTEARWLKKGNNLYYGYKQTISVDERGLVDAVVTSSANVHDSRMLAVLLSMLPSYRKEELLADKGFKTPSVDELLTKEHIINRIMDKAARNKPLTYWQRQRNKLIGRYRYVVKRTIHNNKRRFHGQVARYKCIAKVHAQHVLLAIISISDI